MNRNAYIRTDGLTDELKDGWTDEQQLHIPLT